jgi:hypothetical protein
LQLPLQLPLLLALLRLQLPNEMTRSCRQDQPVAHPPR